MEAGGDLRSVFERLVRAIRIIETSLKHDGFAFDLNDRLGYITACPSNLGTGMRASVHIRLPKTAQHEASFHAKCDAMRLQVRGRGGEHTESLDQVYDVSNLHRLGFSEVELCNTLIIGVTKLIQDEEAKDQG